MGLVTLTEPAAAKVKQLLEGSARQGHALRLRVAGGGCSGLRYELRFDDQVGELDEQFEQHGVRLLVDRKSALHLTGATLDYNAGLNEAGFKLVNPNANSTCGCGESFSA